MILEKRGSKMADDEGADKLFLNARCHLCPWEEATSH